MPALHRSVFLVDSFYAIHILSGCGLELVCLIS